MLFIFKRDTNFGETSCIFYSLLSHKYLFKKFYKRNGKAKGFENF